MYGCLKSIAPSQDHRINKTHSVFQIWLKWKGDDPVYLDEKTTRGTVILSGVDFKDAYEVFK